MRDSAISYELSFLTASFDAGGAIQISTIVVNTSE
jgi:hypothetical protein